MTQLKDELELTKDECQRSKHLLDEEKKRREVVSIIKSNYQLNN